LPLSLHYGSTSYFTFSNQDITGAEIRDFPSRSREISLRRQRNGTAGNTIA
jgi:hypothetical protein